MQCSSVHRGICKKVCTRLYQHITAYVHCLPALSLCGSNHRCLEALAVCLLLLVAGISWYCASLSSGFPRFLEQCYLAQHSCGRGLNNSHGVPKGIDQVQRERHVNVSAMNAQHVRARLAGMDDFKMGKSLIQHFPKRTYSSLSS